MLPAAEHIDWEEPSEKPLLVQFGDLKHSHVYRFINLPHFKKFRSGVVSANALELVTGKECYDGPRNVLQSHHSDTVLQPIVWKLASRRHFRLLDQVHEMDTPWEQKRNMAVFRGQLTGSRDGYSKHLTDEQNCMNLKRCRLVYTSHNSSLVHARLTNTRERLPDILNGVQLKEIKVGIDRLLEYKGIIMLEGNDVASGLKWALLSQSVVLMPPPRHTSWAMEELLEPWVHYIPLNMNATDVEEKMQWVVDHDETARLIAERGTQWMEDLVFHPDAAEDDRLIQEEMIRRYRKHFAAKPGLG
jgi:hypothetical protein